MERHAELGEQLLPWVVALTVVTLAFMLVVRRGRPSRWLVASLAVATVVVAAGALVDVALIGHSGAQATWSGTAAASPGG